MKYWASTERSAISMTARRASSARSPLSSTTKADSPGWAVPPGPIGLAGVKHSHGYAATAVALAVEASLPWQRLEAAFDSLPDDYHEVILLCRIVGLSQNAAAERMGRSVDAVRNLLHRALVRLATLADNASESAY